MVVINELELKKRAEHNYGRLFDLEEVSLHQLNIRRIENLDKFCRQLKIVYLQDNAIQKLENLKRLKCLEYLNISMNVIEVIEGLEGCENLRKLDLTLNFVGQITSILSLRHNQHLEELYLVGNPCAGFRDYRDFVITVLPQLSILDGIKVERSERIIAKQRFGEIKDSILQQEKDYMARREKEREEFEEKQRNTPAPEEVEETEDDITEKRRKYFSERSNYSPETRMEMQQVMEEINQEKENVGDVPKKEKKERQLFMKDGRPFNINEAKLQFSFDDSSPSEIILTLHLWKHLDTESLDLDVQPNFVRLTLNDKLFQLRLLDEVKTDSCTAKRSQTTGYLEVRMPKLNYVPPQKCEEDLPKEDCRPKLERLEVKSKREQEEMDFSRIVELNEQPPDLEPID